MKTSQRNCPRLIVTAIKAKMLPETRDNQLAQADFIIAYLSQLVARLTVASYTERHAAKATTVRLVVEGQKLELRRSGGDRHAAP